MQVIKPPEQREWRVVYRREDWEPHTSDQVRIFQSEPAARRYAARLRDPSGEYWHLSRLAKCEVESRAVGDWEPHRSVNVAARI